MRTAIITISEFVFTALLSFSWKRFILSKLFMILLMESKEKVKDNYLFNLTLIVSNRIKNVISCCIDLHYFLYIISTVPCQEIKWWKRFPKEKTDFLPPRSLLFFINNKITKRLVLTLTLSCQIVRKGQSVKPTPKSCCLF